MSKYRDYLIQYRDLGIPKKELNSKLPASFTWNEEPVIVYAENLIHLLEMFKYGEVDEQFLLDWVNTIWFSDFYSYNDEQSDSIASVMNELEEIDEVGKELTLGKIEKYLMVLRSNVEL